MSTSSKVLTALSLAAVAAVSVLAGSMQHERNATVAPLPDKSVQIALVPLYPADDAARNPGSSFRLAKP